MIALVALAAVAVILGTALTLAALEPDMPGDAPDQRGIILGLGILAAGGGLAALLRIAEAIGGRR